MLNLKSLLSGFPEFIQYVIIIGLVLVIIYAALVLTRFLGKKLGGENIYYDDPKEYDKSVPELFGAQSRIYKGRRKKTEKAEEPSKEDTED